jgi:Rab-like protein 3
MSVDSQKKVKILLLGETGVGKTSLAHVLCHGDVLSSPVWTVGCSVDIKIHDYGRSLNTSSSYFLELWDIGGSPTHASGRPVFYQQTNGIILVHDLTNRKSHGNLSKWLSEFHNSQSRGQTTRTARGLQSYDSRSDLEYDPESFVEQSLPLLVVGTKMDQIQQTKGLPTTNFQGAVCINVNATDARQFAIGSAQTIQFNKFFDKVIERRYHSSLHT